MAENVRQGLERARATLVEKMRIAVADLRGAGELSVGRTAQRQLTDFQNAIDRIDHNLRIIGDAYRT